MGWSFRRVLSCLGFVMTMCRAENPCVSLTSPPLSKSSKNLDHARSTSFVMQYLASPRTLRLPRKEVYYLSKRQTSPPHRSHVPRSACELHHEDLRPVPSSICFKNFFVIVAVLDIFGNNPKVSLGHVIQPYPCSPGSSSYPRSISSFVSSKSETLLALCHALPSS